MSVPGKLSVDDTLTHVCPRHTACRWYPDPCLSQAYYLQMVRVRVPLTLCLSQAYCLQPALLELVQLAQKRDVTATQLAARLRCLPQRVFALPLFTREFCRHLLEELRHFEASDMPKGRPNTMNNHGVSTLVGGVREGFGELQRERDSDGSREGHGQQGQGWPCVGQEGLPG